MEKRIIECVPNFSEGRDLNVIKQIAGVIESVENVKLLDVDPGRDANRTVVTFVGEPDAVCEAAFLAVKKASELIDMSKHKGIHPRIGATDVVPLVPVSGISMEETVQYARNLARRIGEELGIPVYCYEFAAFEEKRKNLARIREGEYEGLKEKLLDPEWKPDFGPAFFNEKTGATVVGARNFLVAFNVNLNTTSVRLANAIAFDVREKGRIVTGENGEKLSVPGTLKSVKAIGWYLEEYGIAQISMNITDLSVTPVHIAFEEVTEKAAARGVRVTGSELVGLIPLKTLLEAGKYYLRKQKRSTGVSDEEIIKIAVRSLGLNDIKEFRPEEKIIEYAMNDRKVDKLSGLSLRRFMEVTSSESATPGGGSVSAYVGALGAALGTMVANVSANKKDLEDRWEEFSKWAEKGKEIQNRLLELVDEDTAAFNEVLAAMKLPKGGDNDYEVREAAIDEALKNAIMVPFAVMKEAFRAFELLAAMVERGNPASVSDAAAGALAIYTCIRGAFLNVKINSSGIKDKKWLTKIINEGRRIESQALEISEGILKNAVRSMGTS